MGATVKLSTIFLSLIERTLNYAISIVCPIFILAYSYSEPAD
jgi:hypothetical protein